MSSGLAIDLSASLPAVSSHRAGPRIVAPFLVTRSVLTFVGLASMSFLLAGPREGLAPPISSWRLLDLWSHFDGTWYLQVARDGYRVPADGPPNVGFLPLLPALMSTGGRCLGGGETALLTFGLIVSNVALLIALTYLVRLIRLDFDDGVAGRAVLYVLLFPTTVFLSALYPMSLILAVAITSVYYARIGKFGKAACIAALAPLARPDGLLLLAPLCVEWLHQRLRPPAAGDASPDGSTIPPVGLQQLFYLAAIPATLGAWFLVLQLKFGDGLAVMHVQRVWAESNWRMILRELPASAGAWGIVAMAGTLLALLGCACAWLRPSYVAHMAVYLALMLNCGRLWSMPRFALVLFPAYVALAILGRRAWLHRVIVCSGALLAALVMVKFAAFSFVG